MDSTTNRKGTKMTTAIVVTGSRIHECEVRRTGDFGLVWIRPLRDLGASTRSDYDALPIAPVRWIEYGQGIRWARVTPESFARMAVTP